MAPRSSALAVRLLRAGLKDPADRHSVGRLGREALAVLVAPRSSALAVRLLRAGLKDPADRRSVGRLGREAPALAVPWGRLLPDRGQPDRATRGRVLRLRRARALR